MAMPDYLDDEGKRVWTETRARLVGDYGEDGVWDNDEVREHFEVLGFQAPFCVANRKFPDGTKVLGSLQFVHHPRFYFAWRPDTP